MHFLVSGGTGFIGSSLNQSLLADGHTVTVLTRGTTARNVDCDYVTDVEQIESSARIDVIINLAGASLAGQRWSKSYKAEIIDSRLSTTRQLLALCERLDQKPELFLSASAIGYYGAQADNVLTEDGASRPGFSSQLCQEWEQAALQAQSLGIRVCLVRLGVVLDRSGGAMEQMALPFKFGVANWMGSGRQWLSWIHRQDVVRACRFLIEHKELSGPFNLTAPEPVTAKGFCQAMKAQTKTVVTLPVPGFAARLLLGGMADELLLTGQRVVPQRLQHAGFTFTFPELSRALEDLL